MWRKRALFWLFICITGLLLLLIRLIQIQLIETETFSKHNVNLLEESVKQRTQELVIDNGRGNFLDRNGDMLTHKKVSVLVLFPFLKKIDWEIEKVSAISGISVQVLQTAVEAAKKPFAFGDPEPRALTASQMEQINDLKIPGVFAIEKKFERSDIPAEQLLGLTGENPQELKKRYPNKELSEKTLLGVSGLEESFDEFLLPEGKSKLVYHVDGGGAPLFGINVKYVDPANPFYPVNVRTSINKSLQQKAEDLVDKYQIKKGGLVLLDIEDNSVLAMVSRPMLNKKDPYSSAGITNRMLKQQIIGSVFKTVVAAAAIDHNLADPARLFDCSKKINGKPELTYDYGMLDFTNSFARSCNRTFGELARELQTIDSHMLEDYAAKLSLTGINGWQGEVYHTSNFKQLADEDKGRVFLTDEARKDANFVAMSGIGQNEVRATPLSVANMMATIARGGKKEMVRAVSKIEYKNGTTMVDFPEQNLKGEMISPFTAMKLQKLLREVVLNPNGTGRWFNNLPYDVAGKSGTAETGKYEDGKQLHNKWFAGYFPYQHPKYALVAVNLDVLDSEGGVNPLFADMVKMLYENDHGKEQ
ncbi:peptidoglycan D,D-transpeptidase FtsI family protein [Neobacillus vireti]|uniref:serine-type D-Ala-D-Ala carboxypeptidase n=1 Tax=Neobacillus vireti LMG 21834 TaxID=1131730 RepID=A0AB94IJL3_9BACI|nr:penicillin-binding transpeptidase domain-containing protein [Neobacillus vireti]ETI67187.1 penicillin-binding protein [Neobacillus vireti LMG 21834]KLT16902.1 penicillin-binding protein [Neobacillus vireti]